MNTFDYTNNGTSTTNNTFDYTSWVNGGGVREVDTVTELPSLPEATCTVYITRDLNEMWWYNPTTEQWVKLGSGGSGGSVSWGQILGNISNQADLQAALQAKADAVALTTETTNRTVADATLQTNIDTLAASKQDTLVSGTNIKTINGNSLLGSGNVEVKTFQPFPSDFITTGTLEELVTSVANYSGGKQGMGFLGEIEGRCLPDSRLSNAECKVEYMQDGIAVLTASSSDIDPYQWALNTASGVWRKWSDVEANPSGTASNALSKISIDGTVYSITGGSGKEYVIEVDSLPETGVTATIYIKKSDRSMWMYSLNSSTSTYEWVQLNGGSSSKDVINVESAVNLPDTGTSAVLYIAKDTRKVYEYFDGRWHCLSYGASDKNMIICDTLPTTGVSDTLYLLRTDGKYYYYIVESSVGQWKTVVEYNTIECGI